jgi:diguanylate cyclase (GGDEF)-like protein
LSATPADDDLIRSIQNQLEGLKNTPDGIFLYRMIDRGLQKRGGAYTGDTARDFVSFLHTMLQRYAANPEGDTVTRVKVRLLQQRLAPHMAEEPSDANSSSQATGVSTPDLAGQASANLSSEPRRADELQVEQPNETTPARKESSNKPVDFKVESLEIKGLDIDESALSKDDDDDDGFVLDLSAESPLDADDLPSEFGFIDHGTATPTASETEPAHSNDEPTSKPASRHEVEIDTSSLELVPPGDDDDEIEEPPLAAVLEVLDESDNEPVNVDFGNEFDLDVEDNQGKDEPDIVVGETAEPDARKPVAPPPKPVEPPKSPIPLAVKEDVKNSSRERVDRLHETFANKLADSITRNKDYTTLLRSNLKALKLADKPDDVLDIKYLLIRGLEDLLQGNESLHKELGATNHYFKISQLDRNLLKDELGRARDLSMVDELTGLQNKTAFNKQLTAEIGRSKRYGFSLALALVVLDDFDQFRELQGNDNANEILRTFSQQILTGFRGYDAVARIGENQFGILFPNTQKEGALSALEKTQKRAADTVIQHNGRSLRMPTFTSSLTLYSPGDQPDAILKRTYDALTLASKNSRDKIIVALAQT